MQDTGEKAEKFMSKKIHYSDEPLGDLRIVPDFLPSPKELALREANVKVTIALSRESVEYFKAEAERNHTKYQRIIRRLLDLYVARQKAWPDD